MMRNAIGRSARRAGASLAATSRVNLPSSTPPIMAISNQIRHASERATPTEVSSILESRIRGVHEEAALAETGRVLSVG